MSEIADWKKCGIFCLMAVAFLCYSVMLYSNLPVKGKPESNNVAEGKQLWQDHNCGSCHQVYGLGGYLGPDLTNVYSLRGEEYIRAFVNGGTKVMPSFYLPEPEMKQLLGYLQSLDASGKSDPRTFKISYAGNIEQK